MYDDRAQVITDAIKRFGVTALPRQFNPQALGNVTPRYTWQIDPLKLIITGPEVMQKLADTRPLAIGSMGAGASGMRGRNPDAPAGEPQHENHRPPRDPHTFGFAVWQLKDGEDKIIADRLADIFSAAPKT
jgi:L-seryl-tRNA(Ser) seleniumtransferase